MSKKAVVLVSGGLDSATALAIAKDEGYEPYAITFRYGQRHGVELEAAKKVVAAAGVADHIEVEIDMRRIGGSALTADIDVPKDRGLDEMSDGIPVTYVPARNTVFLSFALAWAEVLEADHIFIGVNALDYSGYPDCRPEYIEAYQADGQPSHQAGGRGQPTDDPHAADRSQQGGDHPTGHRAWSRLLDHPELLRPVTRRRGLRCLRFVPAPPEGVCRKRL